MKGTSDNYGLVNHLLNCMPDANQNRTFPSTVLIMPFDTWQSELAFKPA